MNTEKLTEIYQDTKNICLSIPTPTSIKVFETDSVVIQAGAVAQEECLFRCSNLFTISKDLYPLKDFEYIYTKDATFVKDFHYNVMSHVLADVITMPAINLNEREIKDFNISYDDECYYLDMIFFMLNAALINGCKNIILGAWGSGVFKNDPKIMAELFKEILEGGLLYTMFDNVVFAVINDVNSVDNNYEVYKKVFK